MVSSAGAVTVRMALPVIPLRVATMLTAPAARLVARPVALTVAKVLLELDHVTEPVMTTGAPLV